MLANYDVAMKKYTLYIDIAGSPIRMGIKQSLTHLLSFCKRVHTLTFKIKWLSKKLPKQNSEKWNPKGQRIKEIYIWFLDYYRTLKVTESSSHIWL